MPDSDLSAAFYGFAFCLTTGGMALSKSCGVSVL